MRVETSKTEGERKPVTILFTDIVGSTSLAEKLNPEEWREIVFGAHRRVSQAVYRYEGTIAQLLGDGVLAFFGAPIIHEDDPIRAVHAALDIQEAMEDYAHELRGYLDNFQLRVGLNSGMVIVGSVGDDLHLEYLAIGDAVNIAARLQSAARPGAVLISDSTARQVKAAFELQSLGEISVKGKDEPVTVFEVAGKKVTPERKRGFEELHSALVGRESELAALQNALDGLLDWHGQIATVIGEAGIGKSRLVEEARQRTAGAPQRAHWIEGRALSYGGSLSFWAITQLIKNDLGLSDGDPEPRVRLALRRRAVALFGEKADDVLPYLAHLLGVKLEDGLAERVEALDGETLKRQSLLSITGYFTRLARERPTVAVFEDLHWADPSSLEAIEGLLDVTDRAPLMVLLVSRLEREHGSWRLKLKIETDFSHRYTEIALKPLSLDEQNLLVDNLLAIADLPDGVRRLILERAEGNPFYLEEIVRSLIEQGALQHDGERWRATGDLTDIAIPDTLQGVLLARIDRLQEDVRRTLQLASVIGKTFLFRLLEAIAQAEQELERHLTQLQRADLVREKSRLPELEYMFKHSLTQEAAYNSLLIERRREFHRKVGEALETLFPDRKEEFLGFLAHHFDAAGEREKAVTYLIQAGDRARLTEEQTGARGFYQRAVELLTEAGEEGGLAQVWLKLGLVYHANFQFEETHQAYEKAFASQMKVKSYQQGRVNEKPHVLCLCSATIHTSLDPAMAEWPLDNNILYNIFSGLVKVDGESNVVPEAARSWQVLDGGRRYLFHLRQDMQWTDGAPVTAQDFEWAWKRNLDPNLQNYIYLYDVAGAREYNEGQNPDPNSVGVCALDPWTLEIRLSEPVAYFPYILALPVAFPLPRWVIERFGEAWWQPEHIVSNGPFRLVEFEPKKDIILERNPGYRGIFPGNLDRVEWKIMADQQEELLAYQEDRVDVATEERSAIIPASVPREMRYARRQSGVGFVVFDPTRPPFDDLRVRQAFALALDRSRLSKLRGFPLIHGGVIPPGIPGHSPEIGLDYDLEAARRLLAEAGYPNSQGMPVLTARCYTDLSGQNPLAFGIANQWQENLGVDIEFKTAGYPYHIFIVSWQADYPDPDNFTRNFNATRILHRYGWRDADFDWLVQTAAQTADRARRMAMYRQADRLLVREQVLVLPTHYPRGGTDLVKPWVKNYQVTPLGDILLHKIVLEDH